MRKIRTPFFMVNPKSYLYGERLLKLAKAADEFAKDKDFDVFFTAPFVDLRMIAENTSNLIVTAQHMDSLKAGRGMGYIVPEALAEAGVKAVFLNHAEHSLKVCELVKVMQRAKENGIYTVVCADSVKEAQAIAMLKPDILLCEPTELIGTGNVSDKSYIEATNNAIRSIQPVSARARMYMLRLSAVLMARAARAVSSAPMTRKAWSRKCLMPSFRL